MSSAVSKWRDNIKNISLQKCMSDYEYHNYEDPIVFSFPSLDVLYLKSLKPKAIKFYRVWREEIKKKMVAQCQNKWVLPPWPEYVVQDIEQLSFKKTIYSLRSRVNNRNDFLSHQVRESTSFSEAAKILLFFLNPPAREFLIPYLKTDPSFNHDWKNTAPNSEMLLNLCVTIENICLGIWASVHFKNSVLKWSINPKNYPPLMSCSSFGELIAYLDEKILDENWASESDNEGYYSNDDNYYSSNYDDDYVFESSEYENRVESPKLLPPTNVMQKLQEEELKVQQTMQTDANQESNAGEAWNQEQNNLQVLQSHHVRFSHVIRSMKKFSENSASKFTRLSEIEDKTLEILQSIADLGNSEDEADVVKDTSSNAGSDHGRAGSNEGFVDFWNFFFTKMVLTLDQHVARALQDSSETGQSEIKKFESYNETLISPELFARDIEKGELIELHRACHAVDIVLNRLSAEKDHKTSFNQSTFEPTGKNSEGSGYASGNGLSFSDRLQPRSLQTSFNDRSPSVPPLRSSSQNPLNAPTSQSFSRDSLKRAADEISRNISKDKSSNNNDNNNINKITDNNKSNHHSNNKSINDYSNNNDSNNNTNNNNINKTRNICNAYNSNQSDVNNNNRTSEINETSKPTSNENNNNNLVEVISSSKSSSSAKPQSGSIRVSPAVDNSANAVAGNENNLSDRITVRPAPLSITQPADSLNAPTRLTEPVSVPAPKSLLLGSVPANVPTGPRKSLISSSSNKKNQGEVTATPVPFLQVSAASASTSEHVNVASVTEHVDVAFASGNIDVAPVSENVDVASVSENVDTASVSENVDVATSNNLDITVTNISSTDDDSFDEDFDDSFLLETTRKKRRLF